MNLHYNMKNVPTGFKCPPLNTTLWRYMNLRKFESLIQRQCIFFPKSTVLDDQFEGSVSKINRTVYQKEYGKFPTKGKEIIDTIKQVNQETKYYTFISCWHKNEYETEFMWKLFAEKEKGIAIKTNLNNLKSSIINTNLNNLRSVTMTTELHNPRAITIENDIFIHQDMYIGNVNYVDYDASFIPNYYPQSPFIYKWKSFEHEKEFRIIYQPNKSDIKENILEKYKKHEFKGIYIPVDISILIKKIIINPFDNNNELLESIMHILHQHNLSFPVCKSSLSKEPVWG